MAYRHLRNFYIPVQSPALQISPLLRLNDDILLNVFVQLDLPSTLALRAVCLSFAHLGASLTLQSSKVHRSLWAISQERSLWMQALQNLSTERPDMSPIFERPLSTYSTRELQHALRRAYKLNHMWQTSHPTPSSVREISLPHEMVTLVPGGRWILSYTQSWPFEVFCHDLHSPRITERLLFRADLPEGRRIRAIEVSNDRSAIPESSFHIMVPVDLDGTFSYPV